MSFCCYPSASGRSSAGCGIQGIRLFTRWRTMQIPKFFGSGSERVYVIYGSSPTIGSSKGCVTFMSSTRGHSNAANSR